MTGTPKGSVAEGLNTSEDDFQFLRDDGTQQINAPVSTLRMDNAEKHFVYFSVSSSRVKNWCVTCKMTLTTELSFDFFSFLSHSLNSLTYISVTFRTIRCYLYHLLRFCICESQTRIVSSGRICYTKQSKMLIS